MIARVSTKQFRRETCKPCPKFWSGVPVTLKKCQKLAFGMLRTFIQIPLKTKLKVIEASNMAQNDC